MSKRSKRAARERTAKRQRNRTDRALDRPVVGAFTAIRTGMRFRSSLSDVSNFHRWCVSWVYIAMNKNATGISQQPLEMFRRNAVTPRSTEPLTKTVKAYLRKHQPARFTEETVQVTEHPFLNVMRRPNPILDGFSLLWLTASHLDLGGAAFWHLTRKGGTLAEIWPLPAQFVWPRMGPNRVFDSYEMRIGGKVLEFPAEDVAHFRKPSPLDTLGAFGPLRGAIEVAESNIRMQEYNRAMFENFGVPDVLITAEGETTAGQLRKVQADFEATGGGWRNAAKTFAVPHQVKITRLSETNRELQFGESTKAVRDEILAAFDVPLPIVIPTDATFSNQKGAMRFWREEALAPRMKLIAEVINCRIMPDYAPRPGEGLGEEFGRETEAALPWFVAFSDPTPEDVNEKVERDGKRLTAGTTTINEVRAENGEEPVGWGEEPWIASGLAQPSAMAASLERGEAAAEREFEGAQAQAVAALAVSATPVPATFAELTALFTQMATIRDVEGANLVRAELANRLGGDLAELGDIEASASAATANPDDAPEPKPEPEPEPEDNDSAIPGQGEKGKTKPEASEGEEGGKAQKPKNEPQKPQKPKGKAMGGADHGAAEGQGFYERLLTTHGTAKGGSIAIAAATWADAYTKIDRENLDEERQDKSLFGKLRALFRAMKSAIDEQVEPVVETARRLADEGKKLPLGEAMGMLFDPKKWIEEFVKVTAPELKPMVQLGAQLAAADVGRLGGTAAVLSPEAIETATQRFARKAGASVIGDFQERFAVRLKEIIEPPEGEKIPGPDKLAKAVREIFEIEDRSRSKMIARTELNNALNAGGAETFLVSGIEEHEWLASSDACQYCKALNGTVVKVGKPFAKVGDVVRGVDGGSFKVTFREITHPTLHPNCVCTVIPVV